MINSAKLYNIESFTFVKLSEREEKYERFQRVHTQKHKEMNFQSMIYTIYVKDMLNNLLYEYMRLCRFVWGCKTMWLKRERDSEVDLRYGVKKNHMFILESIINCFFTYIIPQYIYLEYSNHL